IGIVVACETLKLGKPLLGKNSVFQMALPVNMKLIKDELDIINGVLKGIDMKGCNSEIIETWVRQVRRLAYEMKDIVDQFMYVVGGYQQKEPCASLKKIFKKHQSLFSLDEIATKADTISKEVMELSKRLGRWAQPITGMHAPAINYDSEQQLYYPGHDHSTINDNELSYKINDIWRNMLKKIHGNDNKASDAGSMESAELRRYLIILDDVWTAEVLFRIREVLVDNNLGSRVIITTRIEEVASIAEDGCKIKVEPLRLIPIKSFILINLNDRDVWLLFCRKAFPNCINSICPQELHQCGKDVVDKCDGLPLALVATGSSLSLKTRSNKEWRLFYNQLILELHNNENLNQDYLIHRKRLTRLWIAEGFIEHKGGCSLEDVGEVYLTELVQRSMLQVVARNSFNQIQWLCMHDLVRELAIFQSKKENLCAIYDDTYGVVQVGLDPRRVSVLQCNNDGIRSSIDPSRLRTLIAFDTCMASCSWHSFIPRESKYLTMLDFTMLDLSGLPIEKIPNSVGELFNLRLLCLDETNVKELPNSIIKLHNLQTLSLKHATYRSLNNWEPIEPFEGLWGLKELQSLNEVRATKVFIAKLGYLSQLRSISITYVRSSHYAQLCNSLSKMHLLTRLHIRASNEHELLLLEDLTLKNPLEKLELVGRLSEGTLESPFFSTHGNQLLLMELARCQLTNSPVAQLSELSNLTELRLTRAYIGQHLNFHGKLFQKLKKVVLWDLPQVNQICIHEGALVSLEYLHIDSLKELWDIPIGIKFLNSVKEAYFTRMHSEFTRNFQMGKLNHIPKVYWSQKASGSPS
uniref:NB-ARC domain-containing protein n=1 Tax=Setaria italica TaxID=4555 RepID=K4A037_SETIT